MSKATEVGTAQALLDTLTRPDRSAAVGEHLAEASPVDPASVLEVLDRLIRTTSTTWVRYGLVEHAPEVIARAQASGIEEAEARGHDLTDYLGREGFLRFSDLAEEAHASLDDPDSSAQGEP